MLSASPLTLAVVLVVFALPVIVLKLERVEICTSYDAAPPTARQDSVVAVGILLAALAGESRMGAVRETALRVVKLQT